jgi:hypothetical protein
MLYSEAVPMAAERLKLPEGWENLTFFSKRAGSFSGVPQRTVQAWTEAGLINVKTKGTGDRRRYTGLNCIEIGIVKSFTRERLDFRIAREVMGFLRKYRPSNLQRLLDEAQGYLVIRLDGTGRITPHAYGYSKDNENNRSLMKYWRLITMPTDCEKTLIINVTRIARQVLSNMDTLSHS